MFHQPCLEGATCLSYVERATFTRDTVDNTLHVMFVRLSFDRHQFLSECGLRLENCPDIQESDMSLNGLT